MKIVVDTNRIIAALISKGASREIFFSHLLYLVAPDMALEELESKKLVLTGKAGISPEEIDDAIAFAKSRLKLVPRQSFVPFLSDMPSEVGDKHDLPFLACCLAIGAEGIWTHDKDFLRQKRVRIFTNKDLLDYLRDETVEKSKG